MNELVPDSVQLLELCLAMEVSNGLLLVSKLLTIGSPLIDLLREPR